MAFQPIVNVETREIFAHEALVRGPNNEPSADVFSHVNEGNRYRFDQSCRVKAVQLASELNLPCFLSINFTPNAVYQPELTGGAGVSDFSQDTVFKPMLIPPLHGIHRHTLQQNREVQVVAAREAGGARSAKFLAFDHRVTDLRADR